MRKPVLLLLLIFLGFGQPSIAKKSNSCVLPDSALSEIRRIYPGYGMVESKDLDVQEQEMFREHHADACPGFVKLDFFGTKVSTFAILLRKKEHGKRSDVLVVLTRSKTGRWNITEIEKNIDWASALASEPPGKLEDFRGKKYLVARFPVIVLIGFDTRTAAYAWTGSEIDKVLFSDGD